MAIDHHIKFDGIDGESTSADHKGEIDVLSWHWGLTVAGPVPVGGSGAQKATPGDLSFTHSYDKASPLLAKNGASTKHIKTAVLTSRKAGQGQKDFLKITMKEVLITSVSASADASQLVEAVALSYSDIEFAYRPQDAKGGLGSPVQFNWDIKTGKVS